VTQRIQQAIVQPEYSELVEDYFVFTIEAFDRTVTSQELLAHYPQVLAQTLQCESQQLSPWQQAKTLSTPITYYCTDLVLPAWNAAIVADPDGASDTLSVLELLNVELLEARFLDAQLDNRIARYERVVQEPPPGLFLPKIWLPFVNPYRQAIQGLAELRLESTVLSERVDNALKLIGDSYLASVHTYTSLQFHMQDWDAAISRKLEIVNSLYQTLVDRVQVAQAQVLEVIIIFLILLEIVISLLH